MPKGVECPHAGYVNLALSYADYFDLIPGMDATSLTSSLGYDGSMSEMYCAWVFGCAVVLLTKEQVRSGPDLLPILREGRGYGAVLSRPSASAARPPSAGPRDQAISAPRLQRHSGRRRGYAPILDADPLRPRKLIAPTWDLIPVTLGRQVGTLGPLVARNCFIPACPVESMDLVVVLPNQFDVAGILNGLRSFEPLFIFIQQFLLVSLRDRLIGGDLRNLFFHSSLRIGVLFALRIDTGKHHQDVGSDLVVLGEVLEAVLLGYTFGLSLEPRVSLIKFSDHRHVLLRADETLNLPLGEPDLFHPGPRRRPLGGCRERPSSRSAAEQRDELATFQLIEAHRITVPRTAYPMRDEASAGLGGWASALRPAFRLHHTRFGAGRGWGATRRHWLWPAIAGA
jgi:hypothetical protein